MKKLLAIALCILAAGAQAQQVKYCTPDAVRAAFDEYQRAIAELAPRRHLAAYLGAGGTPEGTATANKMWDDLYKHHWEMTIGMQRALCDAERMARR